MNAPKTQTSAAPVPPPPSGNISVADLARQFTTQRTARAVAASNPAAPAQTQTDSAEPGTSSEHATPEETETALSQDAETASPAPAEADAAAPETEEEPITETAEVPEAPPAVESKTVRDMQKRIAKLTARLRQAEARNGQTEGEPEPANAPPAPPSQSTEVARINSNLATVREALQWASQNPDGGEWTDPRTGRVHQFDARQTQVIRQNAEQMRDDLVAERATQTAMHRQQDQTARQAAEAEFAKAYPEYQPDTPEMLELTQAAQVLPELRRVPDWKTWVADAAAGRKARLARTAKPLVKPMVKPPGGQTPPRVVTHAESGAPKVNGVQKQVQELEKQFSQTGKESDYAKLLAAQRRLRQSAAR